MDNNSLARITWSQNDENQSQSQDTGFIQL